MQFPPENRGGQPGRTNHEPDADRAAYLNQWQQEAEFESELRSILKILRPHRREMFAGWAEHRTRGDDFRVTVAWDPRRTSTDSSFVIPNLVDVLEAILVGSAKDQDQLDAHSEFELYAQVVRDLAARVRELRDRYD